MIKIGKIDNLEKIFALKNVGDLLGL